MADTLHAEANPSAIRAVQLLKNTVGDVFDCLSDYYIIADDKNTVADETDADQQSDEIQATDEDFKALVIQCDINSEDSDQIMLKKMDICAAIFDYHFKTRKAVKLHEMIADIAVQLNPRLLATDQRLSRTYGKCILELPFGQSLEIWKLFLSKFKTKNKFLTRLLAIFLQHLRCLDNQIPNNLIHQLTDIQKQSREVLKKTAKQLKSSDHQLVEMLLELYFSFESLIILQMTYNQNYLSAEEFIDKLVSNEWYDLSIIYDFTEEHNWKKIIENIDDLSPKLIQCLIKSLFQKFHFWKVIQTNADLNEDQKQIVSTSVGDLLSALINNFAANHLNAFTLHQINAITRHINRNDLCHLTDSLATNGLQPNVRHILTEGTVWECIQFQTAFIGSFWREVAKKLGHKKRKLNEEVNPIESFLETIGTNHSYYFKFATLSPNSPKSNKLWPNIEQLSEQLMRLSDEEIDKRTKFPSKLLKILSDCMPLEYLLPANQMRCLLCLSLLLFGIDFTDETKSDSLDLILDPMLRIFDGIRSVWFFNFIDPSIYLIKFLKSVKDYNNSEKLRALTTKFVENIFRNSKQIEELKNKLLESEDEIPFELLVMIETIILKRSLSVLNMKSVPKNMSQLRQYCGPLSHQLANTIHNQIKTHLTDESNIESLNTILIIDSFSAVFEFQVSKSTSDEETIKLKTKWRKLLAKLIDVSTKQLVDKSANECSINFLVLLCGQRKKLANVLPENLITDLWSNLCRVNKQIDVLQLEYTMKSVSIDDFTNNRVEYKLLTESVDKKNRDNFLDSIEETNSFVKLIKPLISAVIQCCTAEEFQQFLQLVTNQLETLDYSLASYTLNLWVAIFESNFQSNEEKNVLFREFLNDLMILSANQCQKCNQKENRVLSQFQLNIKVPVLSIMRSVLHITKNTITSPQIFLAYNACITAKLDAYLKEPEVFAELFAGVYGVLNETLLQHKYIAISSMSSLNLIVKSLLHSLMSISDETKFIEYEPTVRHRLEICSKNMDRLLTLLASLTTDYSSVAPHLIASYVSHTQTVSVHAIIKKNIISGINRLLKLMATQSGSNPMEMIYSRMNESSRKIFKMLFDSYDKYYKFKGQV